VEKFPHLGILHPIHRTMLWGADGGSEKNPWEPNAAMEELVYWGFASFTRDHFERVAEENVREKKATKQPASKKARSAKHFVWPPRKTKPARRKSSRMLTPEVPRRAEEKEEVDTVENRLTEEYLLQEAVDQELWLQQAMTTGIDVDDPEELANFVEVQSLMFASH